MAINKCRLVVNLLVLASLASALAMDKGQADNRKRTYEESRSRDNTNVAGPSRNTNIRDPTTKSSHGDTQNSGKGGCTIALRDTEPKNKQPRPMFLKPWFADGVDAFYLPSKNSTILLSERDVVRIACPGKNIYISGNNESKEFISVTCKGGKFFKNSDDRNVTLSTIMCSGYTTPITRETNKSCPNNCTGFELGFNLDKKFYKQMDICFDKSKYNTLYSKFTLTKTIVDGECGSARPSEFTSDKGIYAGIDNVGKLYEKKQYKPRINGLVGLDKSSERYMGTGLARGHLTAHADFIYGCQHRFTCHFINAAPQWQFFNKGNWYLIEKDVRDYAYNYQEDLTVYTGTYRVATLPHEQTSKDVELFLYVNGDDRKIPVPALFWKVVYNKAITQGVAFLGVNNPRGILQPTDICKDICNDISWFDKNNKRAKTQNTANGHIYCCSVDDFIKVSGIGIPSVNKLLK